MSTHHNCAKDEDTSIHHPETKVEMLAKEANLQYQRATSSNLSYILNNIEDDTCKEYEAAHYLGEDFEDSF